MLPTTRKPFPCSWTVILLFLTAGFCSGQYVQCVAQAVSPIVRGEGTTEPVADYVLDCTGGIPTTSGSPVPMVTFTFTFNAPVTSKVTNGLFNEALLIVDEPNSPFNPTRPLLNCGAPGLPITEPVDPGRVPSSPLEMPRKLTTAWQTDLDLEQFVMA